MQCTRLFVRGEIKKRLFCLFEKNKPFEVCLTYEKFSDGSIGGFSYGMPYVHYIPSNYDNVYLRVASEKIGKELINNLWNGKTCLECDFGKDKEACSVFPKYYKNFNFKRT